MSHLHQDLKDIRISLKLSVEDLYDKTRISVDHIEKIESGIFLQSDANKTYIRSFTRTYARALGIADSDMVHSLDLSDIGSYEGFLREKYLGETPESKKDLTVNKPVDKKSSDLTTSAAIDEKSKEEETHTSTDSSSKKKKAGTPPAFKPEPEVIPVKTSQPTEKANKEFKKIPSKTLGEKAAERKLVNWSETNKKFQNQESSKTGIIVAVVIVLILVSIAAAVYVFVFNKPSDDSTAETPVEQPSVFPDDADRIDLPVPGDTIDAPVPPDPRRAASSVLPDTLTLQIYAAYGNLEPFRVSSDTFESRRPYWVARGEAMQISFVDQITLFNHRDRMIILYNDRVISGFASENSGEQSVTITRQQFVDDPGLSSFTSELPANLNPPASVVNRPVIVN